MNVARPGGAFITLEVEDAVACERLCADDGLCMAWSYREQACELKAIVPAAVPQPGTISGVSARAPMSLRVWTPLADAAPIVTAEPEPGAPVQADGHPILAGMEDDMSSLLLGGLDEDESLRTRLGN